MRDFTTHSGTNTPSWDQVPHLVRQAEQLYSTAGAQTLALQHHAALMRAHAPSVQRLLYWDSLGQAVEEVTP